MKDHFASAQADGSPRHLPHRMTAAAAPAMEKVRCKTCFSVARKVVLRLHTSWDLLHTHAATCKVMHGNVSESRPRRLLLLPRLRRCQYI